MEVFMNGARADSKAVRSGTLLCKKVLPEPLAKLLALAGILISPAGKCGFRQVLEFLGGSSGRTFFTKKGSPVLPFDVKEI